MNEIYKRITYDILVSMFTYRGRTLSNIEMLWRRISIQRHLEAQKRKLIRSVRSKCVRGIESLNIYINFYFEKSDGLLPKIFWVGAKFALFI